MNNLANFVLPGLASALVFFTVIMSCPMRDALLKYHWLVDIVFTTCMMAVLAGTYSGAMTAAIGGIMLTAMLWVANFLLVPIPVRSN